MHELRIVFNNPRAAPELDALATCRIEQKKKCAIVLRQVSECDVLTIAAIIGEPKRPIVDDFNKALRAAAMLKVRRAVLCCGREKGGILFGNKFRELRRDPVGKAFGNTPLIGMCRAP